MAKQRTPDQADSCTGLSAQCSINKSISKVTERKSTQLNLNVCDRVVGRVGEEEIHNVLQVLVGVDVHELVLDLLAGLELSYVSVDLLLDTNCLLLYSRHPTTHTQSPSTHGGERDY